MSQRYVYLGGKMILAGEARISVFDSGLLHGASVFTTMLAHNGKVFRLGRHLDRLMETADLLGMRTDATRESLTAAVAAVLEKNSLRQARTRITLTPGDPHGRETTTLVTAEPLPVYPSEWYGKGIPVVVASYKQAGGDPTYGYKTGCYLPRMLARQEAARKQCEEALWFTVDNRLAEACFCNVFLVLGGTVFTPPRDTPVLPGIVRQAVLELCKALNIPCEANKPLTVKELLAAEEIFLTASCSGIRPVSQVEAHAVGTGQPGEIARKLMAAYADLLDRECPPGPEDGR